MNSFCGSQPSGGWKFGKGSDELTGNDSVVGSPAASRPGSRPSSPPGEREDGADLNRRPSQQGVTLEAFKRAFAGNAKKNSKAELQMEE